MNLTPTFNSACRLVLLTGQHRGKTIGDVGVTGEGLLYLDWLRNRQGNPNEIDDALDTYFANAAIASELADLKGGNRHEH